MCLTLASYSSVESGLKNRVLVQNDGWKYQSFPLWLLCLVTIKFISIVEVTRLESLYTSVAYLYPCYCCQLEFSKNIFLTLSGWLCSLFICVYFFSPSEQVTIAFQNLAQQSNPYSCFTSPLHSVLCAF